MEELKSLLRDGKGLRVAIDIDETLAMVHALMLANFNKAHGTNFTVKDHTDWDFRSIGSSYSEMMPFYTQVWREQWREIPFAGDIKMLGELAGHYTVNLLTTRSATERGMTGGTVDAMNEWIRLHGIDLVLPAPIICNPKQDKAIDFDYHIYVDDSPVLAKTVERMDGKSLFLIDHPYNRCISDDGKKIIRVENAQKATAALISIARRAKRQVRTG